MKPEQTNKEFASKNLDFRDLCICAGIEPSAAQARKFRRGKGAAALMQKNGAAKILKSYRNGIIDKHSIQQQIDRLRRELGIRQGLEKPLQ